MAAHITAAAPKGPRYDIALTREERSSHENGIWCCGRHGRIVDNDHTAYSVDQLRAWKAEAIERQRRAHDLGQIDPGGVAEEVRRIRHDLAARSLKACQKAGGAIIRGVDLAADVRDRPIGSIRPIEATRIRRELERWTRDMDEIGSELSDVISDLHVHLGPESRSPVDQPLFSLLLLAGHVMHWRIWLTSTVEDEFAERKGFAGPNPERWLWWKVYEGDISHEADLRAALAKYRGDVEAWAAPQLVTRTGR